MEFTELLEEWLELKRREDDDDDGFRSLAAKQRERMRLEELSEEINRRVRGKP